MQLALPPADAWQPLPAAEWNADAARHLLRRAGWTAQPAAVERALSEGLPATLDRLFPREPSLLPKPKMIERAEQEAPIYAQKVRTLSGDERRAAERMARERSQMAVQDLAIKWLQFAAQPDTSGFAKWVLFLSDVYVVSAEKVRNMPFVYQHFDVLARHGLGPAPELTKAVSRSPAMVLYLDLNGSQRRAPNENFARELFELFVLGEGNYTEADIKEAARAFTGYRAQVLFGGFRYVPNQHDDGEKTIFDQTGKFTGDDVIDLAYRQNAASTFLPREMAKFYLGDSPLPAEYLDPLGAEWRKNNHDLRTLVHQFFGSRLFFAPEFRGGFIKSPVQFYLGLVQDLGLDIAPLPRFTLNPMRQMGQLLFHPPNVRGWLGGRSWINSATLAARRQLVETLFTAIEEKNLNADELIDLVAARTNGSENFTVTEQHFLSTLAQLAPAEQAERLVRTFLGESVAAEFTASLRQFIASPSPGPFQEFRRLKRAAVALLQSPEYQLC
ncbi:MAG TPA: DUF1800 domain-containing protein [Opitutaceae bacterium]|nr:DUF1800 domain-containing protein [Opitutaceae bacterium]